MPEKNAEGAFVWYRDWGDNTPENIDSNYIGGLGFNASLSNRIYSNSDSVQPSSVRLIPLLKF